MAFLGQAAGIVLVYLCAILGVCAAPLVDRLVPARAGERSRRH